MRVQVGSPGDEWQREGGRGLLIFIALEPGLLGKLVLLQEALLGLFGLALSVALGGCLVAVQPKPVKGEEISVHVI